MMDLPVVWYAGALLAYDREEDARNEFRPVAQIRRRSGASAIHLQAEASHKCVSGG